MTLIASNHLRIREAVDLFLEHQRRHFDTGDGVSRQWNNVASGLRKWVVPYIGNRWLYELNSSLLHELVETWIESKAMSVSTINRYLTFVQELGRWAETRGHLTSAQLASILNVRRIRPGRFGLSAPEPVRPVDLDLIMATLGSVDGQMGVVLRVLLLTGMRPIELRRMTVGRLFQTTLEGEPAIVYKPLKHKTAHHRKRKIIPFVREAYDLLTAYMETHPVAPEGPGYVFSRDGLGFVMLSDPAIRKAVTEATKAAGVARWTPYRLRHTHASIARANGAAMKQISTTLGHASTRTTEIYAEEPDQEAIRAALSIRINLHP